MFGTILRFGRKKKTITNEPARQERYTICVGRDESNYLVKRFFLRYENPYFPSGNNFQYLWKDGEWRSIYTSFMGLPSYRNPDDAYFDKKEDLESFIKKTITPGSIILDRTVSETKEWEVPSKSPSCDDGLPNTKDPKTKVEIQCFITAIDNIPNNGYYIWYVSENGIVQYLCKNREWHSSYSIFPFFSDALEIAKNNLPTGTVIKWEGGGVTIGTPMPWLKKKKKINYRIVNVGAYKTSVEGDADHLYHLGSKRARLVGKAIIEVSPNDSTLNMVQKEQDTKVEKKAFVPNPEDTIILGKAADKGYYALDSIARYLCTDGEWHTYTLSSPYPYWVDLDNLMACLRTKYPELVKIEGLEKERNENEHIFRNGNFIVHLLDFGSKFCAMRRVLGEEYYQYLWANRSRTIVLSFGWSNGLFRWDNLDDLKAFVSKEYPGAIIETKNVVPMAEILQHAKGIVESKEQPYPPNSMDQVESAKTELPRIVHVIKLDALPPKSSTYCAFMQDGLQKSCFHTDERWYTGSPETAPGCSFHRLSWISLGRLKDSLHRTCPNHHILYEF